MIEAPVSEESVMLLLALAEHVVVAGGDAVPFLERVQREHPGDFWANFTLGLRLGERDELPPEAALRYLQAAVAVRPEDPMARLLLGAGLADLGRLEEAMVELRALPGQAGIDNRIFLSGLLAQVGRLDECIAECRAILSVDPRCNDALLRLGYALHGAGRLEEAAETYRRSLAIDPRSAVHESLGTVLMDSGHGDEAIASLREAVRVDGRRPSARISLVQTLIDCGRPEEARTEAEALLASRPTGDPARREAQDLLDRCELLLDLEAELPAIRDGTRVPADGAECLAFAELFRIRREHAEAARYYADAFDGGTGRPFQGVERTVFDATRCAALAGTVGEDADAIRDEERAGWRALAYDWLVEELAALTAILTTRGPGMRPHVVWCLMRLRSDPAYAGVRDAAGLERLPEDERARWKKLWSDAAALSMRAKSLP
jgi:tetratricopeptide (TPR) repeat protein